jgi:membrane protein required for colicin V production
MGTMHAFDVIFGVMALILIFLGIKRGFIEEVMRLAAIVTGFLGALALYRHVSPYLSFLSLSPHVITVISFLIVFFCIAFAIVCVGKLLKKMVKLTMMGWLDRLCGACVGAIKVFFLGWIFVIIASSIPVPTLRYFFKGSNAYSFFVAISPALKSKVMERVPTPPGALSHIPVLSDFWKKNAGSPATSDSQRTRAPSPAPAKKTHTTEVKKR